MGILLVFLFPETKMRSDLKCLVIAIMLTHGENTENAHYFNRE